MAKIYKVWAEVEEYDTVTRKHRDLVRDGITEPVPLGIVTSLHMAIQKTEGLYNLFGGLEDPR